MTFIRFPVLLLLVLSFTFLLTTGCSDGTKPEAPSGSMTSATDCKTFATKGALVPDLSADCISYNYTSGGTLTLQHINTAFNCCPDYEATITIEGSLITLTEHETGAHCNCLCVFDLTYEILFLPAGVYQIVVEQEYLYEDDEHHDFVLQLNGAISGESCITRDHYPWNNQ